MAAALASASSAPVSSEAHLQQLMFRWNETLVKLLALGGPPDHAARRLETALHAVEEAAMSPVASADVERVSSWFGDLVVDATALGGTAAAFAIWHILVASNHHCWQLDELDDPSEAKNDEVAYFATLALVAKRWAESSLYLGESIARDCIELMTLASGATASHTFNDYAPHNNEECGELSLGQAMSYFVVARDGEGFCEAVNAFAYAASMVAHDHEFRPAYRMGLVCWLVQRLRELEGKEA